MPNMYLIYFLLFILVHTRVCTIALGHFINIKSLFLTGYEMCRSSSISVPSGSIRSPNYPGVHGNGHRCYLTIYMPGGRNMQLELCVNSFSLETCCDYLRITDEDGSTTYRTMSASSCYYCKAPWLSWVVVYILGS